MSVAYIVKVSSLYFCCCFFCRFFPFHQTKHSRERYREGDLEVRGLESVFLYYQIKIIGGGWGQILAPTQIKHVDSSVSYQQAFHPKYDRRGRELPRGYGPSDNNFPTAMLLTTLIYVHVIYNNNGQDAVILNKGWEPHVNPPMLRHAFPNPAGSKPQNHTHNRGAICKTHPYTRSLLHFLETEKGPISLRFVTTHPGMVERELPPGVYT